MKNIWIVIAFFVTAATAAQQNVKQSDEDLYTLCKVWGLIKYYHPEVSNGKIDADSLLLASLNKAGKVSDHVKEWLTYIDRKPVKKAAVNAAKCDDADNRNISLNWIKTDKNLTDKQKKYFTALAANPNPGTYYSHNADDTETITYSGYNEKTYKDKNGEERYRILNLFRAWNVIEYFFPYKYAISKSWDKVLTDFIPQFRKASDRLSYNKILMTFSASIEDTHGDITPSLYTEVFGSYGAPFTIQIVENKAVVTKMIEPPYYGMKPGDVIETIDNVPVKDVIAEKSKYIPASNNSVKNRDAFNYLFKSTTEGTFVITGYDKDNTPFKRTITRTDKINVWYKEGIPDNPLVRYDEKTQKTVYSTITDKNIGYIDFSMPTPAEIDSLMKVMKNTKGIIFDLRGYNDNGGLFKTFHYLLKEPKWFGIKTKADFTKPGRFCFEDFIILEKYKYAGKNNPDAYSGKVVVLINEYTQSAEELWAMMFKTIPGVTFIGSQTAGADGNKTPIPLIDGGTMVFSGLGIFYTNKGETQKIGIVPDIVVKPTIKDIQNNNDPLVSKAFEVILK